MKDLPDFQMCDLLSPHFLFVVLPLMILICPFNPFQAVAAHEFQAARAAHFELGGNLIGSKNAAINMEARGIDAPHLLRKMVVSKAQDMSPATFDRLIAANTGGIVLLLPANANLTPKTREAIMTLEAHITSQEVEIPIYFAQESEELLKLEKELNVEEESGKAKTKSAARVILDSTFSNGFQIVANASNPKMLADQSLSTIQGYLPGKGEPENLPTVLIIAHYDAGGAAPSLSFGADANGSGVSILLELARIFGDLYKAGGESHAEYNLVFLLTGGGKLNYYGSKKWLEDQRDFQDQQKSDFLSNVKLVLCLDSLGLGDSVNLHVSKPPKEGTPAGKFFRDLETAAGDLKVKVNVVHKKINLANDLLAWEHERYSIAKLSALTLSHLDSHNALARNSITDVTVDQASLVRNTHLLARALACTVYGKCPDEGKVSLAPKADNLKEWTETLARTPRGAGLLTGVKNPFAKTLLKAMDKATMKAKHILAKRDKRDADYTLYDSPVATINSHSIKPAFFDLILSVAIVAYLSLVYGFVSNTGAIYGFLVSFVSKETPSPASPSKKSANGKSKAH